MKKNRGETLIESLISMFFVTVAIIPVSNLFLKTFQTDVKVDDLNKKNVSIENMIEIIKGKKYEEILNFSGKYEISKIYSLSPVSFTKYPSALFISTFILSS